MPSFLMKLIHYRANYYRIISHRCYSAIADKQRRTATFSFFLLPPTVNSPDIERMIILRADTLQTGKSRSRSLMVHSHAIFPHHPRRESKNDRARGNSIKESQPRF
jgi:hypothetical protein